MNSSLTPRTQPFMRRLNMTLPSITDQHVPKTIQQQRDQPHGTQLSFSLPVVEPASSFQDLQRSKTKWRIRILCRNLDHDTLLQKV